MQYGLTQNGRSLISTSLQRSGYSTLVNSGNRSTVFFEAVETAESLKPGPPATSLKRGANRTTLNSDPMQIDLEIH